MQGFDEPGQADTVGSDLHQLRPIAGGSDAPQPIITNPGRRYDLGYVQGQQYAIWDRQTSQPVQQFPLTDDGWAAAWRTWTAWDASASPAAASVGSGMAAGAGATVTGTPIPTVGGAPAGAGPVLPPYPAQMPGQAYAPMPVPARTNGLAIASLVLGILWLWWVGAVLALIFGYVAKSQIDRSGGTQSGRGLAIAGIVLGWVWVGLFVVFVIAVAVNPDGFNVNIR